jgi:hypothetical protein
VLGNITTTAKVRQHDDDWAFLLPFQAQEMQLTRINFNGELANADVPTATMVALETMNYLPTKTLGILAPMTRIRDLLLAEELSEIPHRTMDYREGRREITNSIIDHGGARKIKWAAMNTISDNSHHALHNLKRKANHQWPMTDWRRIDSIHVI